MIKGLSLSKSYSVIKHAYHKHSIERFEHAYFKLGDQVLAVRRLIFMMHRSWSKFTLKWEGLYVVRDVYSNGVYKIVDIERVRGGLMYGKCLKLYFP